MLSFFVSATPHAAAEVSSTPSDVLPNSQRISDITPSTVLLSVSHCALLALILSKALLPFTDGPQACALSMDVKPMALNVFFADIVVDLMVEDVYCNVFLLFVKYIYLWLVFAWCTFGASQNLILINYYA